jgi:hypothetical protein
MLKIIKILNNLTDLLDNRFIKKPDDFELNHKNRAQIKKHLSYNIVREVFLYCQK